MVEIDLLVIISFHILSLAIGCHEVHVQQGGTAVQVEFTTRYPIYARVGSFRVGIAGGGDAEKYVVEPNFTFYEL